MSNALVGRAMVTMQGRPQQQDHMGITLTACDKQELMRSNCRYTLPNRAPKSPAVLAVLMCAASFLVGHLGPTRQKLLVVFTVTAFHSLILCQCVLCASE